MIHVYETFARKWMALPVIVGVKSETERFAGAIDTYCIEALMQDGKALQAGTSHFLGQNFAKAFDVKFVDEKGDSNYVWATSWGVSTRLMGALIMAHSDDDGLILPPKLAPIHVAIVPIYKTQAEREAIATVANDLKEKLTNAGLSAIFDDRDMLKPGFKFAEHELHGIPVRFAIGPRDLSNGTVEVARRDTGEKHSVSIDNAVQHAKDLMQEIQQNLYNRALSYQQAHITPVDDYETFKRLLDEKGGFLAAHWDGTPETEALIKEETKATIRCIPHDAPAEEGHCIRTGRPSHRRVLFARAY